MTAVLGQIVRFLEDFAPPELAESWDNTGLLLGNRSAIVERIMTCLTLTPDVAAEGIGGHVDVIVSHHPILFRAVQKITSDGVEGRLLLDLIEARIAVYSPHTSFDGAPDGVNQRLADRLGLGDTAPLRPCAAAPTDRPCGGGRYGCLPEPESLETFLARVHSRLRVTNLQYAGNAVDRVSRVAVACGSAAEFLQDAARAGCDLLLTGEARFHAFLEARALGMPLVTIGHYASERPAVEDLAGVLAEAFPGVDVWASQAERDPVSWSFPR